MKDPFTTLGLEPVFDIDVRAVESRHRELSRALHPDRYASAPAAERRMALSRAIEVNEAFRVIKDPIKRAESMFRHIGVPAGETAEPNPSTDLLMEMMEAREELSDAARAKDMEKVHNLALKMQLREREVLSSLSEGFKRSNEDLSEARKLLHCLGELRYLRRFLDEVAAVEEAHFG